MEEDTGQEEEDREERMEGGGGRELGVPDGSGGMGRGRGGGGGRELDVLDEGGGSERREVAVVDLRGDKEVERKEDEEER